MNTHSSFIADRAEFRRRDGDVETRCAVCVVPDADAEVRAVTLVNHGRRPREFELTSYAEVCLNHRRADQAHPAFAKLFLETEFDPRRGALLARRRPRSANEQPVWAIHASAASASANEIEYETDRVRFLGRGRTPANPAALDSRISLVADHRPGARSDLQLAPARQRRSGNGDTHRIRDRSGRHV